MIRHALLAIPLLAAGPAWAQATTPEAAVDGYVAAQRDFDQAALTKLTTADFVEISPVGEVDPRDKVIGFYAADKRQPSPPLTVTEKTVRRMGDTAIVTVRLGYGAMGLRGVYVARAAKDGWRLVSAQYTPIRGPKPA
jgi:ketosteroid isomerase-like protein